MSETGVTPQPSAESGSAPRPAPHVSLWANWISVIGAVILALSVLLMLIFWAFEWIATRSNPYLDIIGYMILPGVFILGLILVPAGGVLKWLRLRRKVGRMSLRLPTIDLNSPRLRSRILAFTLITFFVVFPMLAVSSYEGYHYTESTEFCARACHAVMEPQGVAHSHSPHARVACAECHVGSGASSFVKSKISGARQVLAVMANSYPRPIPPAIEELRPARDICEHCHWPSKFFGSQYKEFVHYSPDEQNTKRTVRMLLHTGGADETIGRAEGIHMHMLLKGPIEFVATDHNLQQIPWVRYTRPDGKVDVFRSDEKSADSPPPDGIRRTVDCMDCHNRGGHNFRAPQQALDLYLQVDRVAAALPFIKRESVEALTDNYPDKAAALRGIRERLTKFYQEKYPQLWQDRRADVERSIAGVAAVYDVNFFPTMKVEWNAYPENIGHLNTAGCFRCHDGRHINSAGAAISNKCDLCHTTLVASESDPAATKPGEFTHSMMLVKHEMLRCDQCHTGGRLRLCRDCHASGDWLKQRQDQQ